MGSARSKGKNSAKRVLQYSRRWSFVLVWNKKKEMVRLGMLQADGVEPTTLTGLEERCLLSLKSNRGECRYSLRRQRELGEAQVKSRVT